MEIRHLRYFIAVAEEGSFVRAAQRLHVSQPPLSTQIKDLEEDLGVRLFDRSRRGASLTRAGSAFYADASAVLAGLERARTTVRRIDSGEEGTLDVGFVSVADYNVLPAALKLFRANYPGVDVQLHELTTDAQLRDLAQRKLDIGIALGPVDEPGLRFVPLLKERLILAAPWDHPLAVVDKPVDLASMRAERFVMVPRALAPRMHDMIIAYCQSRDFVPKIEQFAKQMQTVISLVASDFGFALVPESLRHLQRTGVRYLSLRPASPIVEIGAVFTAQSPNPALPRFVEALQRVARAPRKGLVDDMRAVRKAPKTR